MNYLIVFLLLSFFILCHELGHFLAAKFLNMSVKRFSIGFGPKLIGFRKKQTDYWFSLIPVGGYVMLEIEDEHDFFKIKLGKRIIFALAGPLMNIILSIFCLGLLNTANEGFSFLAVFVRPFTQIVEVTGQFLSALPELFAHPSRLSGIVGIIAVGGKLIASDLSKILQLSMILNLNFAILNLLPIPPLDGGNIVFWVLERIHHKFSRLHVPLAITGWVLLLGLLSYVTVIDVCRHVLRLIA